MIHELTNKTGKDLLSMYVQNFEKNYDDDLLDQYYEVITEQYNNVKGLFDKWENELPSKQQEQIMIERYLWKEYNENWSMLSRRVQRTIVSQLIPYFNKIRNRKNEHKLLNIITTLEEIFYRLINSRVQLPNTPTLVNQGITTYRKIGNFERERELLYSDSLMFDEYVELYEKLDRTYQLSQCNVLSTDDSMEQILETFTKQTLISKQGGGIGLNFGFLRPKDQELSNGGKSSGSVSFIEIFDSMLKTIKQGGKNRRGQGMQTHGFGNLKNKKFWEEEFTVHPDQIEFITSKRDNNGQSKLSNFNISFVINNTKSFLEKLERDEWVSQVFDNKVYVKEYVKTSELLEMLQNNQWKSGDPGLVFLDKINKYNPLYNLNLNITSTNVCGEIPILSSFEHKIIGNCNLISIDLFKFVNTETVPTEKLSLDEIFQTEKYFNWSQFKSVVRIQYEFLDMLLDLLMFPVDDNNRGSMLLRNVGIGITSLQGTLSWLNIPYDSNEGRILQLNLMTVQEVEGFKQSVQKQILFGDYLLFEESDKEVLPNYLFMNINNPDDPFVSMLKVYTKDEIHHVINRIKNYRRNIYVTTVQPSGTVGILMQTNTFGDTGQGIEPFFSLYYVRKYRVPNTDNEWKTLEYMNQLLEIKLKSLGFDEEQINQLVNKLKSTGGKVLTLSEIPSVIREQFKTAMEIHYLDHIKMLEQVQVPNSQQISKTINMTRDQTVEDVKQQYLYQIRSPVIKGITIYRDGSLETQVLVTSETKKEESKETTQFILLNKNLKIVPRPRQESLKSVTRKVKSSNGTLYITMSFDSNDEVSEIFLSDGSETQELLGRLISLQLRSNVDLNEIIEQLKKVKHGEYSKIVQESFQKMISDQKKLGIIGNRNPSEQTNVVVEDDSNVVQIEQEHEHKDLQILNLDNLQLINGIYYDDKGNHYCPQCLSKNTIVKGEGCQSCSVCGWSKCS